MLTPIHNSNKAPATSQPLIAALYARVSTGRQEQEETIDSQLAEIKTRIAEDGYALTDENCFIDDGWSGELLQRPALDNMRDAARSDQFQTLYVYDRGRLARTFWHQEIVIEELTDLGIKFVTLHDIEATTPEGRVMQSMQGVFHEYERVKIAERMRRGKLFKAKQGIIINGQPLFGYGRTKKTDTEPAHYFINEEEAKIVRQIFRWVAEDGLSLIEVRRRLYEEGVPPRKGKNNYWTKGPINRLLQCETYVNGVAHYNKSEAIVAKNPSKNGKYKKVKKTSRKMRPKDEWIGFQVPVILKDRAMFDKVQAILQVNRKHKAKNPRYGYLLTGIIVCGCGMKRVGDGGSRHGHHYYRCAERLYRFNQPRTCTIPGVNALALDYVFWQTHLNFMTNPINLEEFAYESLKAFANDHNQTKYQKTQLQQQIAALDLEAERYAKAYGAGAMKLDQLRKSMEDVDKRKSNLEAKLQKLKTNSPHRFNRQQVETLCKMATDELQDIDPTNKHQVVRDLVDKVIIKTDDVEVCGHIDLKDRPEGLGQRHEDRNSRST